jgi:hypothetical protein
LTSTSSARKKRQAVGGVGKSSSISNLVGAISTFTTAQTVRTTIIASTVFAPSSTTTSSGNTSASCTVVYPAGESWLFLRVVSDSNQTPIVGARVTATHEVTPPACLGSARTTTGITLAFTTNNAEWYSFDTSFSGTYSIVVAYSGHSYSLNSESGNAETATCESLYIPSGRITVNVTAPVCLGLRFNRITKSSHNIRKTCSHAASGRSRTFTPINNPYQGATRIFSSLKLTLALVLASVSLLALVPLAQAASTTSPSPSSGYVAYGVQVTENGTTRAASVNESVAPSSSAGQSIVFLTAQGTQSNFTYSRAVNSSLTLFPYLPAISNQSFSYSNSSYTVSATISQQGTSQVTFQGSSYTLTDYSFSAHVASSNGSHTITGTVSAFPSDLVYSATAQSNSTSFAATLTATSLALSGTTAAPALQAASAGVGLSLAVGAVALSLGVRMKRKQAPSGPSNPDHWVD